MANFNEFDNSCPKSKTISLTFDDAPRYSEGYLDGPTRAKKLIAGLKTARVEEAAFFAVSSNIHQEGQERLENYSRAGHIIANHSHTHPDLNQTELSKFVQDFTTADAILAEFKNFEKWFRFPYLREGDETGKRDAFRSILEEKGYRNAYVTIPNFDWYMEYQFQNEIKKTPNFDLKKFSEYYISTLMKTVEYYDEMAIKYLGRSPCHVILLHETDTNALFIADFVSALESSEWQIISPRVAFQDSISRYRTNTIFNSNPGRVGEIAMDNAQVNPWHESCDRDFLERELKRFF